MGEKDTKRPTLVDKAPKKKDDTQASVESDVKAGSIVLVGDRKRFTLAWAEEDKSRGRAIPVGSYAIRTVRILAKGKDATWIRSSCSPRSSPTLFEAGKARTLAVGKEVHIAARAVIREGKLNLGFALKTGDGAGASVFRNGKRIKVGFELLDKSGRKLTEGAMKYG